MASVVKDSEPKMGPADLVHAGGERKLIDKAETTVLSRAPTPGLVDAEVTGLNNDVSKGVKQASAKETGDTHPFGNAAAAPKKGLKKGRSAAGKKLAKKPEKLIEDTSDESLKVTEAPDTKTTKAPAKKAAKTPAKKAVKAPTKKTAKASSSKKAPEKPAVTGGTKGKKRGAFNIEAEDSDASETPPRKRAAGDKEKGQSQIEQAEVDSGNVDENVQNDATETPTSTGKPRQRSAPKFPPVEHSPIPKTLTAAGPADLALWTMKNDGKTWDQIRAVYENLTGIAMGVSTLPNRYNRMNALFCQPPEDDIPLILQLKSKIEKRFESDKWHLIANALQDDHGKPEYPAVALAKTIKTMTARGRIQNNTFLGKDKGPVDKVVEEPAEKEEAEDRDSEETQAPSNE